MLIDFKIKNYRSIKDEVMLSLQASSDETMKDEATFDCGKVSLLKTSALFGPNASGKSNVVKGFLTFRSLVLESLLKSNLAVDLPHEYFKLDADCKDEPTSYEMSFVMDGEVFRYGFEFNATKITSEFLIRKSQKLFIRTEDNKIEGNKNYFTESTAALRADTKERVLHLSLLAANNKPISEKIVEFIRSINIVSGTERGSTLDYSFSQFLGNPSMADEMKNFITKADFGVTDIMASEEMVLAKDVQNIPDKFKELFFQPDSAISSRTLKFIHKKYDKDGVEVGTEPFDFFSEESDGTQQYFALSAPILDTLKNGRILIIDEIESGLHTVLSQYLISIFNSKEKNPNNAQLIFTTHNLSLLTDELLRRDEIYFTEKNKIGATDLFSLHDISERKNVNFAKRYMEGRYDALPYVPGFEDLKFSK